MTDPYVVEAHYPEQVKGDGWLQIASGSSRYCAGYMDARQEHTPRPLTRIRKVATGKIVREDSKQDSARIGMVAGFPTVEQLVGAAKRVLDPVARGNGGCREVTAAESTMAARALILLNAWPE